MKLKALIFGVFIALAGCAVAATGKKCIKFIMSIFAASNNRVEVSFI